LRHLDKAAQVHALTVRHQQLLLAQRTITDCTRRISHILQQTKTKKKKKIKE
jgi:hypothetical protein